MTLQAKMTMESDAISELESRFTAEDTRLFRMAAERTLPELPPNAANATGGTRSGCDISIAVHLATLGPCGSTRATSIEWNVSCLQSSRLDAVGPVDCGRISWLPATPSSPEPGSLGLGRISCKRV